jgi:hypothetical protein
MDSTSHCKFPSLPHSCLSAPWLSCLPSSLEQEDGTDAEMYMKTICENASHRSFTDARCGGPSSVIPALRQED